MNNKDCMDFLAWLYNRLKIKHNEDSEILQKICYIIDNKRVVDQKINPKMIVDLCEKHYPGFFIEKIPELDMGYSDTDRRDIQGLVSSIVIDTLTDNKY